MNTAYQQIGIDLGDMQSYEYDGYKYIFMCIDWYQLHVVEDNI